MLVNGNFQPVSSSPTHSLSRYPPPRVQTVIYQYLPAKLKEQIPYVSETLRMIHMRVEQDVNIETSLIRCRFNGSILLLCIWSDTRQPDRFTCAYKTLNQQLVIVKMMIRNRPIIVIINAGPIRSRQCFYVSNTYEENKSGFSFGLQAYPKWVVPGWNPVCPDYLPSTYPGKDLWTEEVEIDFIGKHVHHLAYPPRRLYFLSICFPCCLCPQICNANLGNYYPIKDHDLQLVVKQDPQIKIVEISNADPGDSSLDLTMNGLFPVIEREDPVAVDYFSFANKLSDISLQTDYVPPPAIYEGGASGSAMIPNPIIESSRRPSAATTTERKSLSDQTNTTLTTTITTDKPTAKSIDSSINRGSLHEVSF